MQSWNLHGITLQTGIGTREGTGEGNGIDHEATAGGEPVERESEG